MKLRSTSVRCQGLLFCLVFFLSLYLTLASRTPNMNDFEYCSIDDSSLIEFCSESSKSFIIAVFCDKDNDFEIEAKEKMEKKETTADTTLCKV